MKYIICSFLLLSVFCRAMSTEVNDWENPQVNAVNREPMRASFDHYANYKSAKKYGEKSPFVKSLNGVWKFHYVGEWQDRPNNFFTSDFDVSNWYDLKVPGPWEVQGFGTLIYTNARYPFSNNPPFIKSKYGYGTPVGSYVREFDIPNEWDGREIYIRFGGVSSAYYIWVNGEKVGYAEDSFLPSEFNITPYLKKKDNKLAVQVFRWSDGSYLEDQDGWRVSGIIRDVDLIALPKSRISDVYVINDLDKDYKDAQTKLDLDLTNNTNSDSEYLVEATILDGYKRVGQAKERVRISARQDVKVNLLMNLKSPKKWSFEYPNLYNVVVELKDQEGRTLDVINTRTGYRDLEIDGRIFKLNGEAIKMKGVNRVANDPFSGKTISRDRILDEVLLMKRNNINTIRTAHMPAQRWLYELCDEYGIMVIDEANVESHGCDYGPRTLARPEEWKKAHVERMIRMIERDKNHTCVLHWSLGNEAGNGPNFRAMHLAAKELDPSRPTHYHFSNGPISSDIVGGGVVKRGKPNSFGRYQHVDDLDLIAKAKDKRPYLLNEFSHGMGNGMGNLKEYAERFDKYDWLIGGTIWDWSDQSVIIKSDNPQVYGMMIPEKDRAFALEEALKPNGAYFYGYGGDFRDRVNDYNFLCNGVTTPALSRTGKLDEVSKCFQDIEFFAKDLSRGEIEVVNKFYFTPLSDFDLEWTLLHNGRMVKKGKFGEIDLAPQTRGILTLPLEQIKFKDSGEYVVILSANLKQNKLWADKGYRIAWEQFILKPWNFKGSIRTGQSVPKIIKSGDFVKVVTSKGIFHFDKTKAILSSITVGNDTLLAQGPRLDFWRAPIDNDGTRIGKFDGEGVFKEDAAGGRLSGLWKKAGYPNMTRDVNSVISSIQGNSVVVEMDYKLEGAKDVYFDVKESYLINDEGEFKLSTQISASEKSPEVARVGYELEVEGDYDEFTYYGQGEIEAYSDKKDGAMFGLYAGDVKDQFVAYIYPQESGNKYNVRLAKVTDTKGCGLYVRGTAPIETSIRHFHTAQIAQAKHTSRLRPIENAIWHINHLMAPVGNESCGPAPLAKYVLDQKGWSFELIFVIL